MSTVAIIAVVPHTQRQSLTLMNLTCCRTANGRSRGTATHIYTDTDKRESNDLRLRTILVFLLGVETVLVAELATQRDALSVIALVVHGIGLLILEEAEVVR